MKIKKAKPKSVTKIKKKAWDIFSKWIRQRDKGVCITCKKQKHWKEMQAGHYVSRTYVKLFVDEINVNCQCYSCNVMMNGNMDEYAIALIRKYGVNVLEKLWRIKWSDEVKHFKVSDLEAIIEKYKPLLKE